MSRRKLAQNPWIVSPVFLTVVMVLGYIWFTMHYERKSFDVIRGASPEVDGNPFFAAERYLRIVGQPSESVRGLDLLTHPPSSKDVILIGTLPAGLPGALTDSLLSWIRSGGRLLMVPNLADNVGLDKNGLTERLGVRFKEEEKPSGNNPDTDAKTKQSQRLRKHDASAKKTNDDASHDDGFHPYSRILHISVGNRTIDIRQLSDRLLEDVGGKADHGIAGSYYKDYTEKNDRARPDQGQRIEQKGDWLLRYPIGSGSVTVLSDIRIFTNHFIKEHDHAYFLSHLTAGADKVWLVYSGNVDPLTTILWRKFPFFWVSLGITLLLTAWMFQMRSGSLTKPGNDVSQNIMTHIEAVGRYLWRIDRCRSVLDGNRRHHLQTWQKKTMGAPAGQTESFDFSRLREQTGLSEQEVMSAFHLQHETEQDFIRSSQALQKFGLKLYRGDKQPHD